MCICWFFFFLTPLFSGTVPEHQPKLPVEGYSLAWHDEFDGKHLDLVKWNYRGTGKRGESFTVPSAVSLDGKGKLVITASIRNDSVCTGMISTENMHEFTYGYFECRAKFARTPGTISAFWLQSGKINEENSTPEKSGAEIDICEYFPHANTTHVFHTLHWGGYVQGKHRVEGPVLGKLANTEDDFHVVGLEWTPTAYTTFVDGQKTFSGNTHVSQVKEFIILSLEVNALSAGPLQKKMLPDRFEVDYVRVYKKKP